MLSRARLVTLTGVGGVGKTRLALRAAAEVRRAFPDGVWLVELDVLADSSLLVQTIVDALPVRDQSSRAPLSVLLGWLADRQLLLVLDTCEHVLPECAMVAATILRAVPGLRLLVTSRHALRIDGEHVFPVAPLSTSDSERTPTPAAAAHDDAVRLFEDRAKAVMPSFEITDHNRDTIVRICRRLDGLPLAIELAAAQLRVLVPEQILERLDDLFGFLTKGDRAALPRQQTLQAAIDWSFELCSPQERLLWARISVFAGQFDLDAAEAVCACGGITPTAVGDLLADLVEKSILSRNDRAGAVRYRMLEPIRQYGWSRLACADEGAELRRRHRDYYQRLVRRAETKWFSAEQVAWGERLRREHVNLRLALDFCLTEPGQRHIGLAMATALWTYWIPCGALSEGRYWLTRALADEPTPMRAKALWVIGWISHVRGDLGAAAAVLEECRQLSQRLDYGSAQAYASHFLACTATAQGHYTVALALFADALTRHRELGDKVGVAKALFRMAHCYGLRGDAEHGDIEHAMALCQECVRRCEASGESWCRAQALHVNGFAAWKRDDHPQAVKSAGRSLELQQDLGDLAGGGMNLELLAWIAAANGQHERAARLLGAAAHISQLVGAPLSGITQLVTHHERAERQAREVLGTTVFRKVFDTGAELTFGQAVTYALGHEEIEVHPPVVDFDAVALTPRELQVAELIARGLSNKEIAAELVIAQRTVEGHVERILVKLGYGKRIQIALWLNSRRG